MEILRRMTQGECLRIVPKSPDVPIVAREAEENAENEYKDTGLFVFANKRTQHQKTT